MKLKRRYIVVFGILLLVLPKIVDALFSFHIADFLALKHIDAPDMLAYLGSIIGSVFALLAIIVAIMQFNKEKNPIIIPRNCKFFFYTNFGGRLALLDDPDKKYVFEESTFPDNPIQIKIENVTSNPATAFDAILDYKSGEYYRAICDLIGGEPKDKLCSTWETDIFSRQGVFSAESDKILFMTTNLECTVKGIVYRLIEPDVDSTIRALRYNNFIRQSYKIAELTINASDISKNKSTTTFDVEMTIQHLFAAEADYEVNFAFVMQ